MKICPMIFASTKDDDTIISHLERNIDRLERAECLYTSCAWYVEMMGSCAIFEAFNILKEVTFLMPGAEGKS